MIIANRKIIEAVAWVRKYLVAASVDRGLELYINTGITASMLISRPAHMRIKCELRIVINDPRKIVSKMMISASTLISTGRIETNIFGVWAR